MSAYDLDDHLVLYAAHSLKTYVLNPTAALVWNKIAAGRSLDVVVHELAREASRPEKLIRRDVDAIVSEWLANGLLDRAGSRVHDAVRDDAELSIRLGEPAPKVPGLEPLGYFATFRILDFLVRIETTDRGILEEIAGLLGHLRAADPADPDQPTRLLIRSDADGWYLLEESTELARCATRSGIIPLLHTFVLMLSYTRSASFAAIHGAAVSMGDRCVLMPGDSGTGKSTLTAALAAGSLDYQTDDMAVLTEPPIRLRPLRTRIGLKQGSWSVLRPVLPELDELPIYERDDGKRIRYLLPEARTGPTPVDVTSLVFPKYTTGGNNLLEPVPRGIAFSNIADSGYDLPGQISADWVRAMTEWLRDIPCYSLRYDDLDAAVAELTNLVS